MWSPPIIPRVIALPPVPAATLDACAGALAVCVGSPHQIWTIEHRVGAAGARLLDHLLGLERRQRSRWIARIRSRFRPPHDDTIAALRYGPRVVAALTLHSTSSVDPAVCTVPYSGERLREAGFVLRTRGPRPVSSVDALVLLRPPACSLLESRLDERWKRAVAAGSETATRVPARLVRVDGWSTEEWLASRAHSSRDDGRAIAREAIGPVDPTLSAADLLALRTQLVAAGARDG